VNIAKDCTKSEGHMGAKAELKMEATLEATSGLQSTELKVKATCKAELKSERLRNQRLNGR
jgi:hypothetical protein